MATSAPAGTYKYTILAVGVGNALEWYDFAIFGALADVFGEHFFPSQSRGTQLMAAFSVYCSAFFMRPVGGFIFGFIGDTQGRKKALEISIGLMILSSFLIGMLPTYEMIGYGATILIVMLRMLQGIAVGGEMVGAYIYTVEGCSDNWVAFWSGTCKATGLFGTVFGMGFVAVLRESLHDKQFYNWGWRIPFLTSIIMGSFGAYLRSFLEESKEFVQNQCQTKVHQQQQKEVVQPTVSAWDALKFHWPEIIGVAMIVSLWATGFYTSFIWMAYYTTELMLITGRQQVPHAWLINTVMMGIFVLLLPCSGLLADMVSHRLYQGQDRGYRRCMILSSSAMITFACPVFYLINMKTVWSVGAGYAAMSLALAGYGSCMPVVMVNQFSVQYRYTAMGIAYNVANAIFAGTAPLIQTAMVLHVRTPSLLVNTTVIPAVLLMSVGVISTCSLVWGVDSCQHIRTAWSMKHWSGVHGAEFSGRSIDLSDVPSNPRDGGDSIMDSSVSSLNSEKSLDTSISPMIRH